MPKEDIDNKADSNRVASDTKTSSSASTSTGGKGPRRREATSLAFKRTPAGHAAAADTANTTDQATAKVHYAVPPTSPDEPNAQAVQYGRLPGMDSSHLHSHHRIASASSVVDK